VARLALLPSSGPPLAYLHVRLGRLPEAKQVLGELANNDFSPLPFDQEWLFGMSLLTEQRCWATRIPQQSCTGCSFPGQRSTSWTRQRGSGARSGGT
jgi:hypothetical protein